MTVSVISSGFRYQPLLSPAPRRFGRTVAADTEATTADSHIHKASSCGHTSEPRSCCGASDPPQKLFHTHMRHRTLLTSLLPRLDGPCKALRKMAFLRHLNTRKERPACQFWRTHFKPWCTCRQSSISQCATPREESSEAICNRVRL
jgi:hypothetical protein